MKKAFSYWESAHVIGEIDTLIIGGGIVGLSAALRRHEMDTNERVAIVERAPMCGGGSTKNAGFACFGSPSELLSDLRQMSRSEVIDLIRKRWRGLQGLRKLVGDREMDYRPTGGIELFRKEEDQLAQECLNALGKLNGLMEDAIGQSPFEVMQPYELDSFGFEGFNVAINNTLEGAINTGKMYAALRAMAAEAGVVFLNGLTAQRFSETESGVELETDYGVLHASRLLIGTNGFARELVPGLDVTPARNLVLMTEPIPELKWEGTFHMQEGYVYFRNVGQRILIGGARHLDDQWRSTDSYPPDEVSEHLEQLINRNILPFRAAKITHRWTGYLGVGNKKTVLMDEISHNVAYAVRMGGMGVAIGNAVGAELADLLD